MACGWIKQPVGLKPGQRCALALLVLLCFVTALYLPFLDSPLVFDSLNWFSGENLRELSAPEDTDRLLSKTLTLRIYQWFDGHFPYLRVVSVLLHTLTAWLVFLLFRRMTREFDVGHDAAFTAGALFAVHPLAVYAVGYLGQQELILATLFSVLALITHQSALLRNRRPLYALSAAFYLCAMLSKENVVLVPAVALALTAVHRGASLALLRTLILPFGLYTTIAIYFTVMETANVGQVYEPILTTYLPPGTLEQRLGDPTTYHWRSIITQCGEFFHYLLLMLLPAPAWMSIDLQVPLEPAAVTWRSVLGVLAFCAYGAVCVRLLFASPYVRLIGFALAWPWLLFGTELVAVRISEVFVIYRGYFWLPGYCLLAGLVAARLRAWLAPSAVTVVGLTFFALSINRLNTFASPHVLWDEAVRKNLAYEHRTPASFRAYLNRGAALGRLGNDLAAIADYDRALLLSGGAGLPYMNRGVSRARLGETTAALADFDRALNLAEEHPDSLRAKIYANRANALALLGRLDEARRDIDTALRLNPGEPAYIAAQNQMQSIGD